MILRLDNSALQLLHCKRRFQLTVIEGRRGPPDPVLSIGSALHIVLEYIDKGLGLDTAIATVKERYPTVDVGKVISTITMYLATVTSPPPLSLCDNTPAVEVKFTYPYASVITPQGDKVDVELVGTIDRMHIDNDWLVIRDYKSGIAATDSMITSTLSNYDLTFQLPFYLYCMKNSGTLPAVYKDYIANHRYRTEIHHLFYNTKPPTIKRRTWQPFNTDFIDREVPLIINARISEAIQVAGLDRPAPHDGLNVYKACTYCPYKPACLSMGTDREVEFLSRFEITPYDPLSFR